MAAVIDKAAWAALVQRLMAQEAAGNKTRFATTVGVDRKTVTRWAQAETVVSEESVRAVARALGLSARDLLVEVGYYQADELPSETPAEVRVVEDDAAIRMIRESDAPPSLKRELIAHIKKQREEHERQRLAETERMLRIAKRSQRRAGEASG